MPRFKSELLQDDFEKSGWTAKEAAAKVDLDVYQFRKYRNGTINEEGFNPDHPRTRKRLKKFAEVFGRSSWEEYVDFKIPPGGGPGDPHGVPPRPRRRHVLSGLRRAETFVMELELTKLQDFLAAESTRLVVLYGDGGSGKTSVASEYAFRMIETHKSAMAPIFSYSFHGQGSGDVSPTFFRPCFEELCRWLEAIDLLELSPPARSRELIGRFGDQPCLLVLDGLEPLANLTRVDRGKLVDVGLSELLNHLVLYSRWQCIVTSRLKLPDLNTHRDGRIRHLWLSPLEPSDGARLLRAGGVKGAQAELERASNSLGGHPYSIVLTSALIHKTGGCHVANLKDLHARMVEPGPPGEGRIVPEIMERYICYLRDLGGLHLPLLEILGVFESAASEDAVLAVLADAPIPGLTDGVSRTPASLEAAIRELRDLQLLFREREDDPQRIECHASTRWYFGRNLKTRSLEAWQEVHHRLFRHLLSQAPERVTTMGDLFQLLEALRHGVQAGRHVDCLAEALKRMARESDLFWLIRFGNFTPILEALRPGFLEPYTVPLPTLPEEIAARLSDWTGHVLHTMGRLRQSTAPLELAFKHDLSAGSPGALCQAAVVCSVLGETYLFLGEPARVERVIREAFAGCSSLPPGSPEYEFSRRLIRSIEGMLRLEQGRLEEALPALKEAMTLLDRQASPLGELARKNFQAIPHLTAAIIYRLCDALAERDQLEEVERTFNALHWEDQGYELVRNVCELPRLRLIARRIAKDLTPPTWSRPRLIARVEQRDAQLRRTDLGHIALRCLLNSLEIRCTLELVDEPGQIEAMEATFAEVKGLLADGRLRLYELEWSLYRAWYFSLRAERRSPPDEAEVFIHNGMEEVDNARKLMDDLRCWRRKALADELYEGLLGFIP